MPGWILTLLLSMAAAVPVGVVVSLTIFGQTYSYQSPGSSSGGFHGAPGPIAGAGLPALLVAGGGIYWLVRRRKRSASQP